MRERANGEGTIPRRKDGRRAAFFTVVALRGDCEFDARAQQLPSTFNAVRLACCKGCYQRLLA